MRYGLRTLLTATPVSTSVNNVKNQGEECVVPL
jgi:putative SOS response-associated peptidase YedK